jgi:hypothetical protein
MEVVLSTCLLESCFVCRVAGMAYARNLVGNCCQWELAFDFECVVRQTISLFSSQGQAGFEQLSSTLVLVWVSALMHETALLVDKLHMCDGRQHAFQHLTTSQYVSSCDEFVFTHSSTI